VNAQITSRLRIIVVATGLALMLVPVASAGIEDGRSPDTKDAALAAQTQIADGRSPDTLDAGIAAHSTPAASVDLRSPDTKDAAQLAHSTGATVVVQTGSSRFDWTDAGIGAAGGFAVALMLVGTFVLMRIPSRDKLAL